MKVQDRLIQARFIEKKKVEYLSDRVVYEEENDYDEQAEEEEETISDDNF